MLQETLQTLQAQKRMKKLTKKKPLTTYRIWKNP